MASKRPVTASPNVSSPSSSTITTSSSSNNKRLRIPNQLAAPILFTTPPPPWSMSKVNVSFLLLCHSSCVGGVIGKSGSYIKLLQSSTSSTIQILDHGPAASDPDRVIHISAPVATSGSIALGNGEEGVTVVVPVSRAQDALIRVFERILEVAKGEVGGKGIGSGMVSCRLLAEKSKAGPVIGKGGKVIERIRKDTGCRILVLSENLSACASSGDEMIEISGEYSNVQQALYTITGRLRGNLIPRASNVMDSRIVSSLSAETSFHGRLKDPVPLGFNSSTSVPPDPSRYAAPPLDNDGLVYHPTHSQPQRQWE